ncbi:bifunctional protein tyrosine phosphatase family protein/NAD(P)/FAD-dependent oxidoreductase [Acidisoma sp. C75]
MAFKEIDGQFWVSPQLTEADIARAAAEGFGTILCNRPDGEEAGQPSAAAMAERARSLGLGFIHLPIVPGQFPPEAVSRLRQALAAEPRPILAYCRTGTRSATLWALAQAGSLPAEQVIARAGAAGYDLSALAPRLASAASPSASAASGSAPAPKRYDVVVVGGGSAGIATAASLLKRQPRLTVAIVEPAEDHFYQPGWTLVGAGIFRPEVTRRPMAQVMPHGVTWVREAAAGFSPDSDEVILASGAALRYRALVVAPGIKLNWAAIKGLPEALGRNGVTSNYRFDLAPYTYQTVQALAGGRALFTQPPMPIKCAGAPQKALYLSCDQWRDKGRLGQIQVEFHNAGAVLFGVAAYVPALMEYIRAYGVDLRFESKLVAVDGAARVATFEQKGEDGALVTVERGFDMLHAVPPQCAPDFIRESPLAAANGYVDVDPETLRHPRYPNVFGLGDGCSTTNAKTAAAARAQAPVVAVNVLAALRGQAPEAGYDGYGSCPLTVERGKIVLAEFGYGGKLQPTFPKFILDGTRPTRLAWFLKDRILPRIYWHGMLKGREWLVQPHRIGARAEG